MTDIAADEFWRFSLSFYGRQGVSDACIRLQDEHRCDVNLVLYLCWIGLSGRGRLSSDDLRRAEEVAAPWRRDVIEPLRTARRAIKSAMSKPNDGGLYASVKAVELEAEHWAQLRLAALAPPKVAALDRMADASSNLALYLETAASRDAAAPIVAALGGSDGLG